MVNCKICDVGSGVMRSVVMTSQRTTWCWLILNITATTWYVPSCPLHIDNNLYQGQSNIQPEHKMQPVLPCLLLFSF